MPALVGVITEGHTIVLHFLGGMLLSTTALSLLREVTNSRETNMFVHYTFSSLKNQCSNTTTCTG